MSLRDDVKIFKALADENRLAVLMLLQDGEKCACKLLETLNVSQPTLSHHMKLLCDAGIVDYRKEGKWMHYSISADSRERLHEIIEIYLKYNTGCSCCCKEEE